MILVELFTAGECTHCDEARSVIARVLATESFAFRELRLLPGDGLYEDYRDQVPVVHINRTPAFRRRIHEGTLRIRLQQLVAGQVRPATGDEADPGEILP